MATNDDTSPFDHKDFVWCMDHSGANNTAYVSTQTPVGSGVTRIAATDADSGINAELSYHLLSLHQYTRQANESGDNTERLNHISRATLSGIQHNKSSHKVATGEQITSINRSQKSSISQATPFHTSSTRQPQTTTTNDFFFLDPSSGILSTNHLLSHHDFMCVVAVVVISDRGVPPLNTSTSLFLHINRSLPFVPSSDLNSGKASLNASADGSFQHSRGSYKAHVVMLVASVCSVCLVLLLLFVAVVVVVKRKENERKNRKYNCRVEALRMLTTTNNHDNNNNNNEDENKNTCADEVVNDVSVFAETLQGVGDWREKPENEADQRSLHKSSLGHLPGHKQQTLPLANNNQQQHQQQLHQHKTKQLQQQQQLQQQLQKQQQLQQTLKCQYPEAYSSSELTLNHYQHDQPSQQLEQQQLQQQQQQQILPQQPQQNQHFKQQQHRSAFSLSPLSSASLPPNPHVSPSSDFFGNTKISNLKYALDLNVESFEFIFNFCRAHFISLFSKI